MGGCCSACGTSPKDVDREEAEVPNRTNPYADWASKTREDWGSDPTAVARDYPRMRLVVTGPDGSLTRERDTEVIVGSNKSKRDFEHRNRELEKVTCAIARIALPESEGEECAQRIQEAWRRTVDAKDGEVENPDLSGALAKMFQTDLEWYAAGDVESDATKRSPVFNVLLCTAQGIVFYPTQRMSHLLWLPWARHLRDEGWTVYIVDDDSHVHHNVIPKRDVGTPGAHSAQEERHDDSAKLLSGDKGGSSNQQPVSYGTSNPDGERNSSSSMRMRSASETNANRPQRSGTITVTHSFVVRNYIDEGQESTTPSFQVLWAFSITLRKGTGEFVGAVMETPRVLCLPCSNSLAKLRRRRLEDAVFNAFGVDVENVEAFAATNSKRKKPTRQ